MIEPIFLILLFTIISSTKSASKRKQKLDVRNELNESSDDEELDGGQTDKVRQIKDMFPQASTKDAVAVLRVKLWNTEDAVDIFMSGRVQGEAKS